MEDIEKTFRNGIGPDTTAQPGGTAGYAALRTSAAVVDRAAAILRLSGRDPVGMLDAVLTSDVPKEESAGVYALLLDPKGRIQTDLRVLKDGDGLLVITEPEGAEAAGQILGRYAPFSRVEVERLAGWSVLGLYGPRAAQRLGLPELAEHETRRMDVDGGSLLVAGVASPVGGYDLIGPAERLEAVREHLTGEGVVLASTAEYETARVEAGIPLFGRELTPANFPGESSVLQRAVDFKKGCYPGQETVARMHYRGHPSRELHRFVVEGAITTPGAEILQNEKRIGHITSVAPLLVDGKVLALGYLHRNAEPQETLHAGDAVLRPSL